MRYAAVLGTVALTEIMAHFLSLGWGLMTLLGAFAWIALSGATVAAKARSTEQRVNALVPVIGAASTLASNAYPKTGGTISGNVTVTGSHVVNGDHTVNGNTNAAGGITGANGGTLENPSAFHSSGTIQADSTMIGGSFSGGSIHVSGNAQTDGQHSAGSFSGGSIHVSGNAQADGSFSAGNFSGSYHGSQGGVSTVGGGTAEETSLASAINGIISRLNSAGIT